MGEGLRYGIVGAGMMGLEHLRNLQAIEGATVTAVVEPDEVSMEWLGLAVGDEPMPQRFESAADLASSGTCDVVVVASPNDTHYAVCRELLATDLHLLIEKPMATTIEHCVEIRDLAAERDAVTWVGLEYRYMPPVAALVDLVHSGALGRTAMVAIREHRFPFLQKVGDWNRFNERTGGTLVEKCCHFFDLMHLLSEAEPVAVMASGGQDVNHLDERYDGRTPDIIDNAMVVVEHANGVRASLDLCMFAEGSLNQEELSVVGSEAKAEAFLPSGELRVGRRAGWGAGVEVSTIADERVGFEGLHHGSSFLEHLDLIAAIEAGRPAAVNCEDGLRATAVGVAAQTSIAERRIVEIDELLAPYR